MPMISATPNRALHSSMTWTFLKLAEYSKRDDARYFFHNGMHWISHGYQQDIPGEIVYDLWNSDDGITWNMVRLTTPWVGLAPVVSLNGDIVALGEKVYRSADNGASFTVALESPPYGTTNRAHWRVVVRGGYILLFVDDTLWYSNNLTTWNSVALPFSRFAFAIWDFNGYVYVAGGFTEEANDPPEQGYEQFTTHNDVWRSADPKAGSGSWTQITANAAFPPHMWAGYCVHGDEMVLAGGMNNIDYVNVDFTFASRDGTNWREIGGTPIPLIHAPLLISVNGRLLFQNGMGYPPGPDLVVRSIYELRL